MPKLDDAKISFQNAAQFKAIGLKEIHASASVTLNPDNSMFSYPQTVSDLTQIKAILNAIS